MCCVVTASARARVHVSVFLVYVWVGVLVNDTIHELDRRLYELM